jgi:arylsulfatase A
MYKKILLIAICGLVGSCSVAPGGYSDSQSNVAQLPNIVIIFADDLGYGDLGSFGHPYNRTPNLDRLAIEGQRWTDFYVAAPVCSPSRGALLTGRLPVRTGLYGEQIGVFFPQEPGGIPDAEVTLAEALKPLGYATGIFGKWHLGDAPHAWPTRHGFDEWQGVPHSNDMDWEDGYHLMDLRAMNARGETERRAAISERRRGFYADPVEAAWTTPFITSAVDGSFEIEENTRQALLTRRSTEAAVDFMERHRDQPFLLYVPFSMPHTPLFRSEEFVGRSLGGRYGDVIEEIDWGVGQIRSTLESLGLAENTLIMFSSDNGPWLTMNEEGGRAGLLRHGKNTTFEGGVRVPTIFFWPGRIQPGTVSEIGSTLDIFATVMSLVGSDSHSGVDGVDLSSVLLDGDAGLRREMPFYRRGQLMAYRIGPWKLHYITEGAYGQPPERTVHAEPLLYNLLRDPSERFNVAADNPEIVRQIEAAVVRHRAEVPIRAPLFDVRLQP